MLESNIEQQEQKHHVAFDLALPTLNSLLKNTNLNLRELTLKGWVIDSQIAKLLANFIEQNKSLEYLDLSFCKLEPEIASLILNTIHKNPKQLRKLRLMCCQIGFTGARSLANLLSNPDLSLKLLDISANHNLEDGLVLIANAIKTNKTLSELDLSNIYPKNDNIVYALANMIVGNSSLNYINLSSNNISDMQGEIIVSALKENSSLEKVDLSTSNIKTSFGIKTAKKLGKVLSCNTAMKHLILDHHNQLGSYISHITLGLATNKNLTSLHIADTNLDDSGFISLLDDIAKSNTIKELIVGSSKISDVSAAKLAIVLARNELSLTHLNLQSKKISRYGYLPIFISLRNNSTLKSLWLDYPSDAKVDYEAPSALVETLKYYNCTLQNMSGYRGLGNIKEIDQLLYRNKKLASNDLNANEVKSILDGVRKIRWEKRLINQPYPLRFMLGSYSNKINNSTIKKDIDNSIHEVDKKNIVASFVR